MFRRHQDAEDLKGHGRTCRPHPRYQGRAFRSLEIQGRIRNGVEDAGQTQGRRQAGQGRRAGGTAGQCDQPDGCAQAEPERPGFGEAVGSYAGAPTDPPTHEESAPLGGAGTQGGLRRLLPSLRGEKRRSAFVIPRCAIAHRGWCVSTRPGISRFRVRCFASPRNDGSYLFDFRFLAVFFAAFFGTFAPSRRASDRPIAIACLRLLTVRPEPPLFSVPALRFFIARSTLADAFFEYFRAITPVSY